MEERELQDGGGVPSRPSDRNRERGWEETALIWKAKHFEEGCMVLDFYIFTFILWSCC